MGFVQRSLRGESALHAIVLLHMEGSYHTSRLFVSLAAITCCELSCGKYVTTVICTIQAKHSIGAITFPPYMTNKWVAAVIIAFTVAKKRADSPF